MDQSFYAHNKSLMDSETQQRLENVDSPQIQRADGPPHYPPPVTSFSTSGSTGATWPPYQTSGHQAPPQNSNQLHNGPLNGFQLGNVPYRPTISGDFGGNKSYASPQGLSQGPPLNARPSSSGPGPAVPHSSQSPSSFSNSGFTRPPFQTTSPNPPVTLQQQVYSTLPNVSFYQNPTTFDSVQNRTPYFGTASSSSVVSPAGSHEASRSETPVLSSHKDQTRNQSLANLSSPNLSLSYSVPPSQMPHASVPATSSQSSSGTTQHFFPPTHPQLSSQQPWQRSMPPHQAPQQLRGTPQNQGVPQLFHGTPQQQQQLWTSPSQQQMIDGQHPLPQQTQGHPQQMPWQSPQAPPQQHSPWQLPQAPPTLQGYPQQQPPWQQQHQTTQPPQQFHPNHLSDAHQNMHASFGGLGLKQEPVRLCNITLEKNLVPKEGFKMQDPVLGPAMKTNCIQDIMCCTLNVIPNSSSLLKKTRLPLGILLHPFKDLSQLPLVQSSVIVRCKSCRTYINPFVVFLDPARWRCNVCQRVNEVPPEFMYDHQSQTCLDPYRRPEVKMSTIEYVAPAEYLVRPPMPAVYLYLLDVSHNAIETGYLEMFCQGLLEELDRIPGDARKQIGFIAYDTSLYFFNLSEEQSQPQMIVVPDLEEAYLPIPEGLLVKLNESKSVVVDLLQRLPSIFRDNRELGSAMGSALEFATKLMVQTGGRISIFQTLLPTVGAGALKNREEASQRVGKDVSCLGVATDFYKKMALACSTDHVAVDLFLFNSQYSDIATIGSLCKYTGGCMYYFPCFHATSNRAEARRFKSALARYLTRKIGFEAVMRIRCSKGMSIQSYHGNFFVRSVDLLNLPNLNPDAGYAVQVALDNDLETKYVSFQTALLYTSSKAERRIRVHTLCIPVSSEQSEIEASANQLAIVSLLSKMAVDKSLNLGLGDSREALVNAAVDILTACASTLSPSQRMPNHILAPRSLELIPLLVLALLKSTSFRIGIPTKIDDRVVAMEACKNLPWKHLLLHLHPYLYPVHNLGEKTLSSVSEQEELIRPPVVSLSVMQVDRHGAYLMDAGSYVYFYLGPAISDLFCRNVLGVSSLSEVAEGELELTEIDSEISLYLRAFVAKLNSERPVFAPLVLIKEGGRMKHLFYQHLVEDRTESSFSYLEFLNHIHKEMKV